MSWYYKSYIKAFTNYATKILLTFTRFREIGWYAMLLTEKARELSIRASKNAKVRIVDLQLELATLGKGYVVAYARKFKNSSDINRPRIGSPFGPPGSGPVDQLPV